MSSPTLQRLARLSLVPGICIALALVAGAYANKDKEANTAGVTAQAADTAKQLSVANPSPAKAIGQALGSRLVGPRANRNGDPLSAVGCPVSSCVGGVCTLTQSLDPVTDGGNQVACADIDTGETTENGWARCYNLVAEGVPPGENLTINSVTFGVQQATIDGINIDVVLYLDTDGCPPVEPGVDAVELCRKSIVVNIADEGTMITVDFPEGPVVPAGTDLIVEIESVDDGTDLGFIFRTMSNANGQCGPSYIRAADCGLAGWVDLADIKFPDAHLIQIIEASVGGTPANCGNGILEGCEECDPPGPDCLDNCRLAPVGACCNFDGMNGCAQMSDGACAATKTGEYLGDDTDCADCEIIPDACVDAVGSCNEVHPEPGCDTPLCCALVCAIDPFCCVVEWNQICVDLAAGLPECAVAPTLCPDLIYDNGTYNLTNGGRPTAGWTDAGMIDDFETTAALDFTCVQVAMLDNTGMTDLQTMRIQIFDLNNIDGAGGGDGTIAGAGSYALAVPACDNTYSVAAGTLGLFDTGDDAFGHDVILLDATGPKCALPAGDYGYHLTFPGTGAVDFWNTADPAGVSPDCASVWGTDVDLPSPFDCAGVVPEFLTMHFKLFRTGAPCPADIDGSGDVGVKDLLFLLGAWGDCPAKGPCLADFDESGDVGVKDLLFLLGAWGLCP